MENKKELEKSSIRSNNVSVVQEMAVKFNQVMRSCDSTNVETYFSFYNVFG